MVYRPQLFDVQWCLFSVELSFSEVSNRVHTLLLVDRRLELLRFLRSPLGPHVDVRVLLPKTIVDDKIYAYFGVVRPPSTLPLPCSETDSSTSIQQIHIGIAIAIATGYSYSNNSDFTLRFPISYGHGGS